MSGITISGHRIAKCYRQHPASSRRFRFKASCAEVAVVRTFTLSAYYRPEPVTRAQPRHVLIEHTIQSDNAIALANRFESQWPQDVLKSKLLLTSGNYCCIRKRHHR